MRRTLVGAMTTRTAYLDHAATTPMRAEAVEAMAAHLLDVGNPSSLHASGRKARRVLDALHWLGEREGAEVELLPVDQQCRLDVEALRASVERDPGSVALISVMWANNKEGSIEPNDED